MATYSKIFFYQTYSHIGVLQPPPNRRGLASPLLLPPTFRIPFGLFSTGYLDVSVHRVPSIRLMNSGAGDPPYGEPGCPIRKPSDHRMLTPTRRLSRSTTSFLGQLYQGIHCLRSLEQKLTLNLILVQNIRRVVTPHIIAGYNSLHFLKCIALK